MVDIVDLRNLVAEAEGTTDERATQENFASGYDIPFGYGRYLQPSKPISQMTFQELKDFQRRQVNATKGTFDNTNRGTSAVGRYQFIRPTLENLQNRLGYKDTDVFSPEVQDRLFDALMEEQGLQELSAGLITPEEFQEKLSSQFASIPKPGTETGTYKGQGTGVTSDRVSAVLSSMQDPSGRGDTFRPDDDSVLSDTGTVTGDQAEEEPGFLDTVGEYVGDAYDTASEYVGETVDTLERVAESVGDKLRRLLGSEEEQQSSTTVDNPPIPERRPVVVDNPPIPKRRPVVVDNPPIPEPRPNQTKKSSFNVTDGAEALYSLATTGSRASARKLRDMVAQQLGVYESSQEATSEAKKYGLNEREVDTLRHILGAGLLKYIGKDFTQPLLQGTELFEKIPIYAQRLLDPDSEDTYRKSYYDQSIEEANIDIVNYQVGAALAKQYDTKDDFIKSAVKLVKDLGKGKTPVVVDKMPTRFGLVDKELTPRLSTGVVYPPEELKRRGLIYNQDVGTLTAPPVEDYGFVEPAPGSNLEDQGPAVLEKAEGGSVEKKAEFVKEDDDDVPDPPPGATPEEVADDIPAYLSTGEYVLPANVVRYIGLKNITDMHQRALTELQQMEDLDIIENVDENGYVEEDDDEMDYMEPEGVVEIVVAEHHPKGIMAKNYAEGGLVEDYEYVPGVGYRPKETPVTQMQESVGDLGEYVSGVGFVQPPKESNGAESSRSSEADAKAEAIVSILDGIHSVYNEDEDTTTPQFFGKDEEGNLLDPTDPRSQEQLFKLSEAAGRDTFTIIQGRGENSDMAPRDKGITRFLRNVTGPDLPGKVISNDYLVKGLAKLKKDVPEKVFTREVSTGQFVNPFEPEETYAASDLLQSNQFNLGTSGGAKSDVDAQGNPISIAGLLASDIGRNYGIGRSDTPGSGNTSYGGAGVKSYPGTSAGWKAFTTDVGQGFEDLGSFATFGGLSTTIGKGLADAFGGRSTFTSVGNQGLPASIAKGGFITKKGIMRPRIDD